MAHKGSKADDYRMGKMSPRAKAAYEKATAKEMKGKKK